MNWWNTPWGELRLPLTNGGLIRYIILLIIWHLSIFGIGFWFGRFLRRVNMSNKSKGGV